MIKRTLIRLLFHTHHLKNTLNRLQHNCRKQSIWQKYLKINSKYGNLTTDELKALLLDEERTVRRHSIFSALGISTLASLSLPSLGERLHGAAPSMVTIRLKNESLKLDKAHSLALLNINNLEHIMSGVIFAFALLLVVALIVNSAGHYRTRSILQDELSSRKTL